VRIRELQFEVVLASINLCAPLIYMWEVRDAAGGIIYRYIGKSDRGAYRPLRVYPRTVRNLLSGKPYRKSNPKGYRKVHWQLASAAYSGNRVRLRFLCNVPSGMNSFSLERHLQKKYNC
jgi:hypothetical protein